MKQLLLLTIGLFIFAGCSSTENFGEPLTEGEPTPIPTAIVPSRPVYEIQRGDVVDERTFFGRVTPIISQSLHFVHDGRVIATHYDRGDVVQEGDLIAELDTSALEEALSTAQSDLEIAETLLQNVESQVVFETQRAQLTIDLAQLSLDYALSQASDPLTAEQAFEISSLEIEHDLAQLALDEVTAVLDPQLQVDVTRAQQRIDDIQEEIEQMFLYAPMDGTVTSFQVDVGDVVSAFNTVGLISDDNNLEVRDTLGIQTLEELVEGMPVRIALSNVPDDSVNGTLLLLPAPYGSGDDEFVHIRFDIEEEEDAYASGDRVSITIVVNERSDALWLPPAAIRDFNGRNFVVIEENGAQRRVDVEVGIEGGGRVEIVAGVVEEGQTVIGQ